MSSPNKSLDGAVGGPISLAKVRNIVKLSSDVSCIGTAQCVLLAKVADLFTSDLVHAAYLRSTSKSIDYTDLCGVVHEDESLDFIHPLIPKQMTYKEYKEWLSRRGEDEREMKIQPTLDLVVSQKGTKKKTIKKNKVVKKNAPSKDNKNKKKILSPTTKKPARKKPAMVDSNKKKQSKAILQNGIKKYFIKMNK